MQPITLVLSSYEPNNWTLTLDPGVAVDRIILNGYYEQSATVAASIPVTNFSGPDRLGSYAYRWPLSTGGSSTQDLLVAVEDYLGTRIASFTGAYQASSFTVTGTPAGTPDATHVAGAGGFSDGGNPDLIYDPPTGRVQIDLSDLAAQYPFGSGEIWWQHFDAQRLFIALANYDGTFDVGHLDPNSLSGLRVFGGAASFNANRIGYDSLRLGDWNGQLLDLGMIFPPSMTTPAELHDFLAAAHFSTDREYGEFDLIMTVPEPAALASLLATLAGLFFVTSIRRSCPVAEIRQG